MPSVRSLSPAEAVAAVPALADILIDCVYAGASVSFQPPLDRERAQAFWLKVAGDVATGNTMLLVADHADKIAGTVQVQFAGSDNQPHRADIAKMLVHTSARRLGLAAALMRAAEQHALRAGRSLLTLDTQTGGGAEKLYAGIGWTRVGEIPGYALTPFDGLCSTTIFYKQIG